MVTVRNLLTNEETQFDKATVPAYAVAYCYCMEHNLASWFFNHVHDNTLDKAYEELPMMCGKVSVGCGDFACLLEK